MSLIVVIRWFHALAAAAWVGGMLFYVAVLNPALKHLDAGSPRTALVARVARQLQELTQAAIAVLLLTGAVLTFDRLSQPHVLRPYVVVLAVKIVLSLCMVALASGLRRRRRRKPRRWPAWLSVPYLILVLGLLVYLLAILLQVFFDLSYGAAS